MGERVLCKHEVVGSIPSGSTTALRGRGVEPVSSEPIRKKAESFAGWSSLTWLVDLCDIVKRDGMTGAPARRIHLRRLPGMPGKALLGATLEAL